MNVLSSVSPESLGGVNAEKRAVTRPNDRRERRAVILAGHEVVNRPVPRDKQCEFAIREEYRWAWAPRSSAGVGTALLRSARR